MLNGITTYNNRAQYTNKNMAFGQNAQKQAAEAAIEALSRYKNYDKWSTLNFNTDTPIPVVKEVAKYAQETKHKWAKFIKEDAKDLIEWIKKYGN